MSTYPTLHISTDSQPFVGPGGWWSRFWATNQPEGAQAKAVGANAEVQLSPPVINAKAEQVPVTVDWGDGSVIYYAPVSWYYGNLYAYKAGPYHTYTSGQYPYTIKVTWHFDDFVDPGEPSVSTASVLLPEYDPDPVDNSGGDPDPSSPTPDPEITGKVVPSRLFFINS